MKSKVIALTFDDGSDGEQAEAAIKKDNRTFDKTILQAAIRRL